MEQQEYLIKLSIIQQEAEKLEQKMQIFDQQVQEMQAVKTSLEELSKGKDNQEILSGLGKGIFIKTEINDKNLFVNAGKGVVIKKNFGETISILDSQIKKLLAGKQEIMNRVLRLQDEMQRLIEEAEN